MANTKLPLWKWLKAINLFYTHRSGLSACTLQREIEVTYKVAWRMLHQLRGLMADGGDPLQGVVEIDETYVGGRKHPGSRQEQAPKKTAVFGTLERGGRVRTTAVAKVDKPTIFTLIKENVAPGSKVYSDEHSLYTHLPAEGYHHASVLHKKHEWKRGPVSTNGMEAYWSKVKRTIRGAYVSVSERWLQRYLDECSFRHNRRKCPEKVQDDLLSRLLWPSPVKRTQGPPGLFRPLRGGRAK
jgi:transposase-like protein